MSSLSRRAAAADALSDGSSTDSSHAHASLRSGTASTASALGAAGATASMASSQPQTSPSSGRFAMLRRRRAASATRTRSPASSRGASKDPASANRFFAWRPVIVTSPSSASP